ncbi:MAG: hypothetical protein WBP45_13265 [Daejeonella sp.]
MNNKLEALDKKCKEIEDLIRKNYVDENNLCEPIIDGIVNIEKYIQSNFRILWILKEPYDDVEDGLPSGGGWHLSKDFLEADGFYKRIGQSRSTWHPIIYTSYGILNDFIQYDSMDYIRDDENMAEIVRNVAFINVKKTPGLTRTYDNGVIWNAYSKHKHILLKQIETYNPDIIIGGSTMPMFFDDLEIRDKQKNNGSVDFAIHNYRLFIHAYHPAQTKITRDKYVDDIINTVKLWKDGQKSL